MGNTTNDFVGTERFRIRSGWARGMGVVYGRMTGNDKVVALKALSARSLHILAST